jgi:hypothetical protein
LAISGRLAVMPFSMAADFAAAASSILSPFHDGTSWSVTLSNDLALKKVHVEVVERKVDHVRLQFIVVTSKA